MPLLSLLLAAVLPCLAADEGYTPPPPPSNWTPQQKMGYNMGVLGAQMIGQGLNQLAQPQQQGLALPPPRDGSPTEVDLVLEENRRRLQEKMGGDGSKGLSFRVDEEEPKPCRPDRRSCEKAPEPAPEAVAEAKPKPKQKLVKPAPKKSVPPTDAPAAAGPAKR